MPNVVKSGDYFVRRFHFSILALSLLAGCSTELETGYKPKRLGATPEERRAYYAPQFSPAAAAAQTGEENAAKIRRPLGY